MSRWVLRFAGASSLHDRPIRNSRPEKGAAVTGGSPSDPDLPRLRLPPTHGRSSVEALCEVSSLFDAMPELGWTARGDGYIDYYNRGWYEFTGTTYEDMKGWGWEAVHDPAELPRVLATWRRSIAQGVAFELEFPLRRRDGVYRWFLTRAVPIRDEAGELIGWVGVNTDIDDNKNAEQKLAALRRAADSERKRLQVMFQESPAAVCLLRGQDLVIELVNPLILKLWGRDDAVLGKPLLEALPELRGQGFDEALRGVLETGIPYRCTETRAPFAAHRDGTPNDVFVDFVYVPLHAASGAVEGVFMHAYDVTDKVNARTHAERLREEALCAVHSREQLLAIVSHDLRNPLSTVLMGAKRIEQLAEQSDIGVPTKKVTSTILKAVDRMSRLVSNLLDLAKLEGGQTLPVDVERVDIVALTRQAVELLEPLATARKLTLRTEIEGPAHALCDGDRVEQVLSNLLGNALKFTREGGAIEVEVTRNDREILIRVSDTGIGIPAHELSRIFAPYWQADAQRKRGAGLGLSIAKGIVDALGGRIWVETTVGQGSSFYFTLPAADPDACEAGKAT
jgi:PAS domain S-box-containing protein